MVVREEVEEDLLFSRRVSPRLKIETALDLWLMLRLGIVANNTLFLLPP